MRMNAYARASFYMQVTWVLWQIDRGWVAKVGQAAKAASQPQGLGRTLRGD